MKKIFTMLLITSVAFSQSQLTEKTPRAIRKEKRAELVEAHIKENSLRLSIAAQERKERIADWIVLNPGKNEKDYWDWQEKRQKDKYIPIENLDRIKSASY